MAGFGGAVKLTGESEYRRAIQGITQDLSKMSSALKSQTSEFASNDGSVKATAAKQKELAEALREQQEALAKAKSAYAGYSAAVTAQQTRHSALTKEYKNAVLELDRIRTTSGEASEEYRKQAAAVDKLEQELAQSNAEMDESKSAMQALKREINDSQRTISQTEKAMDELGNETEDAGKKAEKAGDGFTVMKGVLSNLATSAIGAAINGVKKLGGALVDAGKQALDGYANYEQLVGGVKKIFGEDLANEVMANADVAFKTAGMSANEYMETVTNFSATLLQGLGDDTSKAAQYADTAIRNMSDNANTFGTDMASIQNAYQGFAKDNYTMLDNLKLGYGGTAGEMARLINESGVLGDSMEVTAKNVKDVPFYQMIEAIDITQQRMGIMGTTAKEAAGTIQGSTGSMKAAWQNMLTGMANENANFETLAKNFIGTLITEDGKGGMLGTIIPRIATVVQGMSQAIQEALPMLVSAVVPVIQEQMPVIMEAVQSALQTISDLIPEMLPVLVDFITQLSQNLVSSLPTLVDTGMQVVLALIQGLNDALPDLISMMPTIIETAADTALANLPLIVTAGMELLVSLVDGLTQAIPELVSYIPTIIETITTVLQNNIQSIVESAVLIMESLINGLVEAIPQLAAMTPQIIMTIFQVLCDNLPTIIKGGMQIIDALINGVLSLLGKAGEAAGKVGRAILDAISGFVSDMLTVGSNLVSGIWDGISGSLEWIKGKISGWVGNVVSFIKGLFGIHSPSKVMRDQVGKQLALGLIAGVDAEKADVELSASELAKAYVSAAKSRVQELKKANKLSETEEINYWRTIVDSVKKGTRSYETAVSQLTAAKNRLKKDVAKFGQDFVKEFKAINSEMNKNIKELKQTYRDTINKRQEQITNSFKLFEGFTPDEAIGKQDLISNLNEQVKALKIWDATLDNLRTRIKNKDLLADLESMGVGSVDTLINISGMSNKELAKYEKLYAQRDKIAKERAKTENQDLLAYTNEQVEKLKANAQKEIKALQKTYIKELKALGVDAGKEGKEVGKQISAGISQGFSKGMSSLAKKTKEELQKLLKAIKKELKIKSPSQVYRDEIGDNLAKGIGVGFADEMKLVTRQMQDAVPKELDVATTIGGTRLAADDARRSDDLVNAFKDALAQMKIELDDEVAGRFVDKTVTRLIYA